MYLSHQMAFFVIFQTFDISNDNIFSLIKVVINNSWVNYRPQTKFAKVMFLHVSVCPQGGFSRPTPRGGRLRGLGGGGSQGLHLGGCPGPGQGDVSQHALRQTPPHQVDGYCCGRYASYWNAFLLTDCIPLQRPVQFPQRNPVFWLSHYLWVTP